MYFRISMWMWRAVSSLHCVDSDLLSLHCWYDAMMLYAVLWIMMMMRMMNLKAEGTVTVMMDVETTKIWHVHESCFSRGEAGRWLSYCFVSIISFYRFTELMTSPSRSWSQFGVNVNVIVTVIHSTHSHSHSHTHTDSDTHHSHQQELRPSSFRYYNVRRYC
jgi:hypothetical protein